MKTRPLITVLLSMMMLTACQTARMQVPPSLAAIAPLDVQGANPRRWNAPIRFGPWATLEAREGFGWDFGYRLLGLDVGFKFQPFRIAVSSGGSEPVQGECVTLRAVLSRKDLSVDPSFGKIPALACGFRGASVGEGTLWMETTATNAEEGELDYAEGNWSVRSIRRFEGSSIPSGSPIGYEIRKRDRVIGAVETINRGRVWMDPSLNEKEQARLAAAATALLLYEPPE